MPVTTTRSLTSESWEDPADGIGAAIAACVPSRGYAGSRSRWSSGSMATAAAVSRLQRSMTAAAAAAAAAIDALAILPGIIITILLLLSK